MSTESAILRGMLAEMRQKKMTLAARIAASLRAAKLALAGFEFKPLADVDIAGAAIHMRTAEALMADLNGVEADIARAEKELA